MRIRQMQRRWKLDELGHSWAKSKEIEEIPQFYHEKGKKERTDGQTETFQRSELGYLVPRPTRIRFTVHHTRQRLRVRGHAFSTCASHRKVAPHEPNLRREPQEAEQLVRLAVSTVPLSRAPRAHLT